MRGLFLAVTTLALAVAAPWILSRPIFLDEDHVSPLLRRPTIGGVSLESQRRYYSSALALLVAGHPRREPGAAQRARPLAARGARQRAGRRRRSGCPRRGSSCSPSPSPERWPAWRARRSWASLVQFTPDGFAGHRFHARRRDRRGRRTVVHHRRDPRKPLRRRAPGVLPRQPRGRAPHQRSRGADPAPVLPGRVRPVLFNVRDLALAGSLARQPEVAPGERTAASRRPARWRLWPSGRPCRRPSPCALEVEQVSVRFGHRIVVDDVDLDRGGRARWSG